MTGRVQGVGFRASLQTEAWGRGLCGWVRNTGDGAVEFHVQGDGAEVEQLLAWTASGPPLARVAGVESDEVAPDPAASRFEITG